MVFNFHMNESVVKWAIILFATYIIYVTIKKVQIYRFKRANGCKEGFHFKPSYFGIPYIRNIIKAKNSGRFNHFVKEHYSWLPKNYYSHIAGSISFATCDPENIKAILSTQFDNFGVGLRYEQLKPLFGLGIFTADGDVWKHSRAMLRPQFAKEHIKHVQMLEFHLQVMAKHIRKYSNGETFDFQDLMFRFTLDAATDFLLGQSNHCLYDESIGLNYKHETDAGYGFRKAIEGSQTWISTRSFAQSFYFLINDKEGKRQADQVREFCRYYVNKAFKLSPKELEEKSKDKYYLLYEIMKTQNDKGIVLDQVINVLLAGRDTTGSLISFVFFELARNPEIWNKLKNEIYKHFGYGSPEDISKITFETLKQCQYLRWVIFETLRMYPTLPLNFRISTKRQTLPRGGGKDEQSPVFIEKGQVVIYKVLHMHRREEFYGKDVDVFRPERWEHLNKIGWSYLPFNGGPRTCLGQQFALTQTSYVTVRLAQMFPHLESRDPEYPPKTLFTVNQILFDGCFISMK
ncbi:unnamed protein product [Candida verbasci]|uniref:Cytochrome P450 n=1 Tax=Candida verbasci TaxID=1227364 RepID=A0A9W4X9P9_9ASCO|nr:unnamed protein product [Candida verbasci]